MNQWIYGVIGAAVASILSGWSLWLLNRYTARVDKMEARIHQIDLQIAKDLPSKEDFREIKRELESVSATMHEVRDMVIRLEERNKSNG